MNENNNCVYQRANTTPERLQPELHGVSSAVAFKSQTWQAHRLIDELAVVVVSEFRVIIFWVFLLGSYPTPHVRILVLNATAVASRGFRDWIRLSIA